MFKGLRNHFGHFQGFVTFFKLLCFSKIVISVKNNDGNSKFDLSGISLVNRHYCAVRMHQLQLDSK